MLALKALLGEKAGENYNLKMAGDMSARAEDMTIIACVGDSITRGSQGLPDNDFGGNSGATNMYGGATAKIYLEQFLSYPANLQRELWQTAYVYNFGRGNSTAGDYGDAANYYANSQEWANCLAASDSTVDFDLVFMMHGTNDSLKAGGAATWDADAKANYRDEVQAMVERILVGSPEATFVLNNVPHRFDTNAGAFGETHNVAMQAIQLETAQYLKDMGIDIYHYDMNAYTREVLAAADCDCYDGSADIDSADELEAHGAYYNCTTPNGKQDGTHPSYLGYNLIAEGLAAVVDYVVNGAAAPAYMIDLQ